MSSRGTVAWWMLAAIWVSVTPARAQYVEIQSFEVTPFVGLRLGGAFVIQADGPTQVEATLKDAASYGLSAGVRFDDLSLVEFRWTRATSALRFGAPFAFAGAETSHCTSFMRTSRGSSSFRK